MRPSDRDREMARQWLGPVLSEPGEVQSLADLLATVRAEGVKAALAAVRNAAPPSTWGIDWNGTVQRAVDEAERALSVTPREAEEGKGT